MPSVEKKMVPQADILLVNNINICDQLNIYIFAFSIIKLYLSLLKIGPVLFSGEIHAIKLKGNEIVLETLVDIFLG
jgi:uncharacterized membrane protein YgdD (TMEM256/DUF423 family)